MILNTIKVFAAFVFFGIVIMPDHTLAQIKKPVVVTPYPAVMTQSQGTFVLSSHTRIYVPPGDIEAKTVAVQLSDMLSRTRNMRLIVAIGVPAPQEKAIILTRPTLPETSEEAYKLTITASTITLSAARRAGLYYGAVTLWQMASQETKSTKAIKIAGVSIVDKPRYSWRGLMVDSVRHYQSMADLKRLIDVMSVYKLNVLHWHLTDDQGWRLEIKKYPKLTQTSAWRIPKEVSGHNPKTRKPVGYGGFYTQDQVRDLVAYASARNVTIVPEVEMPGHATAALTAYPEYGVLNKVPDSGMSDWGVYSNLYNVDDKTFAFLDDVLNEVMDLFPSAYIHIGGDEAIKNQWRESPYIQERIKVLGLKDENALQTWFISRIGQHLHGRGRHLIGWDEILEGGPDTPLPADTTVMSWRGLDGAMTAAKLGHDTILTPGPALYLDSRQSLSALEGPGRSEVSTLRTVYDFDSTPSEMPPSQYHHIIGVQANAWTEHMRDTKRLEEMVFPRLTALAEVAWTPEGDRDWGRYSDNLTVTLAQLKALGVAYDAVPFEPDLTLQAATNQIQARLISTLGLGDMHYSLDGSKPSLASPIYTTPLAVMIPTTLKAQTYLKGAPLGGMRSYDMTPTTLNTRKSSDLKACGDSLPLRLEDDAPVEGKRAVFVINIYKPCWVWEGVDLSRGLKVTARIGQAPFNFQLAGGKRIVGFDKPITSPYGELIVRQRTGKAAMCEGRTLVVIPVTRVVNDTDTLSFLTGQIEPVEGTHDLCFTFNRLSKDVLWAIDQITLMPSGFTTAQK